MHAKQGKMGDVMIKEHALGPAALLMAALALLAFLPLMHVVGQVAAMTLFADLFFIQFTAMACGTQQFGVFTLERKLGLLVVIEVCVLPAFFGMAGITLLAITTVVLIIVFMAAVTVLFRFYLIHRLFMTSYTDNLYVSAS